MRNANRFRAHRSRAAVALELVRHGRLPVRSGDRAARHRASPQVVLRLLTTRPEGGQAAAQVLQFPTGTDPNDENSLTSASRRGA
jgi:hypothetical protein